MSLSGSVAVGVAGSKMHKEEEEEEEADLSSNDNRHDDEEEGGRHLTLDARRANSRVHSTPLDVFLSIVRRESHFSAARTLSAD